MSETVPQTAADQAEQIQEQEEASRANRLFGKKKPKDKKKKNPYEDGLDWICTILLALIIAVVVRGFIYEPVSVEGSSMWPTLFHHEIMLVNKWDYLWGGAPDRFDVVICHYPGRGNINFVKRVVGLPGDTVSIQNGTLYVNGEAYEEPYLLHRSASFGPITVPEGSYFVMGDNRTNSNDSRNLLDVGAISRDMILGKVTHVVFPFDHYRAIPNGLEDTDEIVILAPEAHQ